MHYSPPTMEQANTLNTQGSAMMAAGNYSAAAEAFNTALGMIKSCSNMNNNHDDSIIYQHTTAAAKPTDKPSYKLATTHAYFDQPATTTTSAFEIFDHCFVAVVYDKDSTDLDLLIASMVYNFALAHQLAGLSEQQQQQGYHFHRATRLYRFAFEILQKLECCDDSMKLCLAIANNLAALSLECCDYNKFDIYRAWVCALLTHVSDEGFYETFFIDNFASVGDVQTWPAPAA